MDNQDNKTDHGRCDDNLLLRMWTGLSDFACKANWYVYNMSKQGCANIQFINTNALCCVCMFANNLIVLT